VSLEPFAQDLRQEKVGRPHSLTLSPLRGARGSDLFLPLPVRRERVGERASLASGRGSRPSAEEQLATGNGQRATGNFGSGIARCPLPVAGCPFPNLPLPLRGAAPALLAALLLLAGCRDEVYAAHRTICGGSGAGEAVEHELHGAPLVFAPTSHGFGLSVVLDAGAPDTLSLQVRPAGAAGWIA